jgi:hypothetical protein
MLRYRRLGGYGRYGWSRLGNDLALMASSGAFQVLALILTGALALIRAAGRAAFATSWQIRERVAYLDGFADLTPSDQPKQPVSAEVALIPVTVPTTRKDRVR